jgi:CheY-like chemotaxis protein
VAKILVADDNSNIQKMVGLALKDQGIDVVAVGNGEAAVRKISDVRPDLVLADVFMPVRNGYEVCKYVKGDSSLSHIPVILLVGAFDPLDEEEAQRVGADGVLKKPFVPPDPLISMVKSALIRASTGNLNSLKPSGNSQPSSATVTSIPNAVTVAASNPAPAEADVPIEPVSTRPPELKIEPGTQAPAFGSLLETSPSEAAEDTGSFATTNPHVLERDWGGAQEEEEEEEEESSSSWRPDAVNEAFPDDGDTAAKKAEKKKKEHWTPTREKKQDLLEGADEPQFVSEPVTAKAPATKPSAPPPSVPLQASSPSVTPLAPVALTPTASAKPPITQQKAPAAPPKPAFAPPAAKPVEKTAAPVADTSAAKQSQPKETEKPTGGGAWFSISSTPWEADAKQAGQTAPAWDAPAATTNAPVPSPGSGNAAGTQPQGAIPEAPQLELEPEATGFYTDAPTLPELVSGGENIAPATVEALRQEATQVVEESASLPEYTLDTPAAAASDAAPDMDALVAKVLAKLSPEVLQAVTREILKPVVEAMVREEVKAKKS